MSCARMLILRGIQLIVKNDWLLDRLLSLYRYAPEARSLTMAQAGCAL